jgi:hypothetical protein
MIDSPRGFGLDMDLLAAYALTTRDYTLQTTVIHAKFFLPAVSSLAVAW